MKVLSSGIRVIKHPILSDDERTRCEVWTRVMGYHRPVSSFNVGKQGEHAERTFFIESRAASHACGPRDVA